MALESDYSDSDNAGVFRDMKGKVLHRGSAKFKEMASIEGSAKLKDGRVLTYSSKVRGEIRWKEAKNPYGMGATCPLVPMRSAAVDPRVIPLGARLFIPDTKGLGLPDGSVHNGVWYAVDSGASIKNNRIDLFSGSGKTTMSQLKGLHMKPLSVTVTGFNANCTQR